jgi:CheY-like chemotaxis protein
MRAPAILIVEDEIIIGRELESRLQALGYRVPGIATSGLEAIRLAEQSRPDLVLMDIVLPGETDGIDTAQLMRQRWSIPIVYLTAYTDKATLLRAKVTKPYGYIVKPYSEAELQANVEMALYKHQAEVTFLTALENPDPQDRAAYLDVACAGDPALRKRAEALFQSIFKWGTILAPPEHSGKQSVPAAAGTPGPHLVGEYHLIHAVGKGANGTVFKGFDAALRRIVAIKVLAPQLATGADAREQFVREARAMAAIRSDYVVDVYGVGETTEGVPYLVMEFIDGVSLAQELVANGCSCLSLRRLSPRVVVDPLGF